MAKFNVRDKCPACGSATSHTLFKAKFTEPPLATFLDQFYRSQGTIDFGCLENADYVLARCATCELVYQQQIPNDELMYVLYEQWIDPGFALRLHEGYTAEYFMRQLSEFANVIDHLDRPPATLKCLDFGMGWGIWCKMAEGFGCDVYGSELSQARIDHATARGVRVLAYDDIRHHQFDFIHTEQVFEHIANPLETLSYLKESLGESGIIKISVPDGWNVVANIRTGQIRKPASFRGSLISVQPLEHINSFNYRSLVAMAGKAGLRAVQVPPRYSYSWRGVLKSLVKPAFYLLRGSQPTRVYFTHA